MAWIEGLAAVVKGLATVIESGLPKEIREIVSDEGFDGWNGTSNLDCC